MHILAEYHRTDRPWEDSTKDELNWVRIFSRNPYRSVVGVMQFVNVGVNYSPMQEAMYKMEAEVLTKHTKE